MTNALLDQWTGPAGGVPAFDRVRTRDIVPAFEAAAATYRAEISAIADDPAPPTFANVCGAFDRAGEALARVDAYYSVWRSSLKDEEMRAVEVAYESRDAALRDEVVQNEKLFARIEAVNNAAAALDPEQQRLCAVLHRNFVLRGARLNADQKRRVAEINQRLASLASSFDDNVLREEQQPALILDAAADLAGLPASYVDACRVEAERQGRPGQFVVANTRSSVEPFLSFAQRRDLRERAFRAWTARGESTNPPLAREILNLRRERARLFGFQTHAHWKLADKMLTRPEQTLELMTAVWDPALRRARRDIADMQKIIDQEGGGFGLAAWDHRYYAEKVRRARFDLDPAVVRPFLRFENVRDALFFVAGRLYGLKFTPIEVPVFHPDVRAYRVDDERGEVGLFYLDPFARPNKSSGAWMGHYRPQRYRDGRREVPIISNSANFIRGEADQPVLLSWDDARTLFHEFGHGLHGLCSDVRFDVLQGTRVATDYVEFPSHFHENYLRTEEVLSRLVNDAGERAPADLIDKIKRAESFNAAFATVEFLGPALADMMLHLAESEVDPAQFTADLFEEIGMPPEIAPRHALAHFNHAFAGDHYSAGYYSYLWSDVLACDGFAAFTETGDAFDPAVAQRLKTHVLAAGNSRDPAAAYRDFRGRDPAVAALLRARGLDAGGER